YPPGAGATPVPVSGAAGAAEAPGNCFPMGRILRSRPLPCGAGCRTTRRMAKLCEGRVVIVTGAGRGIGREHALMLGLHGAKVIVNDLGGARDGTGASAGPADEVVHEIRAAGGEASSNADNVADFAGAERMVRQALSTFGRLDAVVNNAGILRDRMLVNMT